MGEAFAGRGEVFVESCVMSFHYCLRAPRKLLQRTGVMRSPAISLAGVGILTRGVKLKDAEMPCRAQTGWSGKIPRSGDCPDLHRPRLTDFDIDKFNRLAWPPRHD